MKSSWMEIRYTALQLADGERSLPRESDIVFALAKWVTGFDARRLLSGELAVSG